MIPFPMEPFLIPMYIIYPAAVLSILISLLP